MKEMVEFTVYGNCTGAYEEVSVKVRGLSEMSHFNQDLKISAAIVLLSTVQKLDFYEDRQEVLFDKQMDQLRKRIDDIQFQ